VATLTGTKALKLSDEEQEALRTYLEDGGTVVIDAAGGSNECDRCAKQLPRTMFGPNALRPLPPESPVYKLDGYEIEKVKYRRQTAVQMSGHTGNLRVVFVLGRPAVIYSREDITAALVGYPSYTCDGYSPESAFELMRNIVLIAAK
jgi:hypothetical protein